eukprot:COSAG02_NODE_32628_length_513_cov_0.850242_1_plen_117_part_10
MGTLLRERSSDLYRSKGVLSIHGQGSTKFVFQGVHESINFGPAAEDWKEGDPRINKMVFIGKDLDKAALREGFGKCSTYSSCLHHPAQPRPAVSHICVRVCVRVRARVCDRFTYDSA